MKLFYFLLIASSLVLSSCTKQVIVPDNIDVNEWMRTHEQGEVAYVDYYTGNYIVGTNRGYTVVESWGGVVPREYDRVYANFSLRGVQTIYNRSGNYFTQSGITESWLTWSQALYLLDELNYQYSK